MSNLFTNGTSDLKNTTKVSAFLELLARFEILEDLSTSDNRLTVTWGSTDDNLATFNITLPYTFSKDNEKTELIVTNYLDGKIAGNGAFVNTGSELSSNDYPNACLELAEKILDEELLKTPVLNRIQINYGTRRNKTITISGNIEYTNSVDPVSGNVVKTAIDYLA